MMRWSYPFSTGGMWVLGGGLCRVFLWGRGIGLGILVLRDDGMRGGMGWDVSIYGVAMAMDKGVLGDVPGERLCHVTLL